MTTVERLNKLTNQIEKESRKDWNKINHSKIAKLEEQSIKCGEMIRNSQNLQNEYELVNGCEWEG